MITAENALPPGYALHEYRIDSLIGTGGFGLTYLATDANLNLKVALKEYLPSDFAASGEDCTVQPKAVSSAESYRWGLQRFMDEARALASFRHPNIVRVMRFFEANSTGYMVMEFVEGKPLPEWVESRQQSPSQQMLLDIVMPLLDGLEVIHKASYLHRDIKPANIFIRDDGSPVLLDFGSARLVTRGHQELTAVVSPGYAPFEQYHTHGNQGPWSDLYALGGVMYWLITGTRPVEAAARVRKDIMPPAARPDNAVYYSGEFLDAIDWAMRPHEEERPQNVTEFRRALLSAAASPGQPASTIPLETPRRVTASSRTSGTTGSAVNHEQMKRVETELSRSIGPIAAVVVRNAAKSAASLTALVEAVSGEIANEAERSAFLRKFASPDTSSKTNSFASRQPSEVSISQKFGADVLQKAEATLAQYIGAIARVVVRRAAAKARDEAELYLLIADEIKDPGERKAFIRKAVSISHRR
jgi:serine/threonine protein kinase